MKTKEQKLYADIVNITCEGEIDALMEKVRGELISYLDGINALDLKITLEISGECTY